MMSLGRTTITTLTVLSALLLTGCEDMTISFKNTSKTTKDYLVVLVDMEGGNSETLDNAKWYKNRKPKVELVNSPEPGTVQKNAIYRLTWKVKVKPGESYRIGADFGDECPKIKVRAPRFRNELTDSGSGGSGSLVATPRKEKARGLVMDIENSSANGAALIVEKLQWSVHTRRLPLNRLNESDRQLNQLDWRDITPKLPLRLEAGRSVTFDVPDEELQGKSHALLRWTATDPQRTIVQQPIHQISIAALTGQTGGGSRTRPH